MNTPFDPSVQLHKNDERVMAQLEYASAISRLMHLMQYTKLHITFEVSKMSRLTSNPNGMHWKAIKRMFCYLLKTKSLGLHYDRYPEIIQGYANASLISYVRDHKFSTGWIFTLARGAISRKSKEQTCITLLTMES